MSEGHIGILATARTIASLTFEIEIRKLGPHLVSQRAAPLLAPIVEEGWENTEIALQVVERYVRGWDQIDTLVLACTHYPILLPAFRASCKARILDPAPLVAERLAEWLDRHPEFDSPGNGEVVVQCTSDIGFFREHGARFFGSSLPNVERLVDERGRLLRRGHVPAVVGQVVR